MLRSAPALFLLLIACVHGVAVGVATAQQGAPTREPPRELPSDFGKSFGHSTPEQQGIDSRKLIELTEWLKDAPIPVFSLLVSRHGKLVYELYTSGLDREAAHYLMSVTKSVTAALVGIAIDQKLLAGPEAPVTRTLPRSLFASDQDFARLRGLTIQRVLGMAALDAPVPPRDQSEAAVQRQAAFWAAPNRVAFALTQALLPDNVTFQYNDVTPMLATGLVQYASGQTAFEFAEAHLFGPLGFRNAEWLHQDAAGIDQGGYGLRLRPIDMQKFGVLYLRRGDWDGKQLISKAWVDRSFTPWNKSQPQFAAPNYGWYWWTRQEAPWTVHEANGWKGQRIAVIPEQGLVVTMTACIEDGSEEQVFARILTDYLRPALQNQSGAALPRAPALQKRLEAALAEARASLRIGQGIEPRMVPSVAPKESRRPFAGKQ